MGSGGGASCDAGFCGADAALPVDLGADGRCGRWRAVGASSKSRLRNRFAIDRGMSSSSVTDSV